MRRALSLFAAAALSFSSTLAMADAGADSGSKDSGIGTTPSPNNPVITPDSGAGADAGPAATEDSGGCSVVAPGSEGWSSALGLGVAAGILVLSRRRRARPSRG